MGQPGGNALFAAIGARVWLDSVGLLTRLGRDYPPERLVEIRARGICLGLCAVDAPMLHDWALYEADGVRQFVNHISSGKNDEMTLLPDEIPPEHGDGRAYHVAPVPTDQQAALVESLRRPGRLISLDPHEWWITGYEATLERMLGQVDFFLPSRHSPVARVIKSPAFKVKNGFLVAIMAGLHGALMFLILPRILLIIECWTWALILSWILPIIVSWARTLILPCILPIIKCWTWALILPRILLIIIGWTWILRLPSTL